MFFKRVLLNVIIVTVVIGIACYLNEKVGISIYGFEFISLDFANPFTYVSIIVLAIVLSLMWGGQVSFLKQAGLLIFLVFVLMLVFDFYYNTNKNNNNYKIEKKEQIKSKSVISSDTMHVGLRTIYLLSSGGTIDAICDNGYVIKIEAQNNQNSTSWTRLVYTFDSKYKYMDALDYINKKGYRWIINHQFENEYSWNAKHQISYEDEKTQMKIVNTMYLSEMKKTKGSL